MEQAIQKGAWCVRFQLRAVANGEAAALAEKAGWIAIEGSVYQDGTRTVWGRTPLDASMKQPKSSPRDACVGCSEGPIADDRSERPASHRGGTARKHFCSLRAGTAKSVLKSFVHWSVLPFWVRAKPRRCWRSWAAEVAAVVGPTLGGVLVALRRRRGEHGRASALYAEREGETRAFRRGYPLPSETRRAIGGRCGDHGHLPCAEVLVLLGAGACASCSNRRADRPLETPPRFRLAPRVGAPPACSGHDPAKCPLCRQGIPLQKR